MIAIRRTGKRNIKIVVRVAPTYNNTLAVEESLFFVCLVYKINIVVSLTRLGYYIDRIEQLK